MIKHINNVDINYIDYGEGKNTVVLLHGWGQNIEMMKMVGDKLQKYNRIIIVDLPGFGNSPEPDTIWTMYDYTECIHNLLKELKVDAICFGSESNDPKKLTDIAKVQLENKEYDKLVKTYLDKGENYPTAMSKALHDICGNTVNLPMIF